MSGRTQTPLTGGPVVLKGLNNERLFAGTVAAMAHWPTK
jgi:hypothetical protein